MENSNDNIYTEARLKIFQCESWECKQLNMIYKQCWKVSQINNQTKNILNSIIILMLFKTLEIFSTLASKVFNKVCGWNKKCYITHCCFAGIPFLFDLNIKLWEVRWHEEVEIHHSFSNEDYRDWD